MYEDSNRNKINMIGVYLMLYHDINYGRIAKLMTIAKSNIDNTSKSGPSNTIFLEFTLTLTLLMYAGKLNRYEINYFVLLFVHMHVLMQSNAHVKNSNIYEKA